MKRQLVKELVRVGRGRIHESFTMITKDNATYFIDGSALCKAINQHRDRNEEVNVLHWFNEFWVYTELALIHDRTKRKKKVIPFLNFTLSVFQGDQENAMRHLMRAEWDHYPEENSYHAQPHWHVYSSEKYADYSNRFGEPKESEGFAGFVESKQKSLKIDKFHFAMNGQWSNKSTEFHSINHIQDLPLWFDGVLTHIQSELKHL